MRHNRRLRRGNCLLEALIAVAVLGLLLLLAGTVAFFVWNPASAAGNLRTKVEAIMQEAVSIEAPCSVELDLKAGGTAFFIPPEGKVGDKLIPMPPGAVQYSVSVTDPEGKPVRIEANPTMRRDGDPFAYLGFCEIPKDGKYTVEVTASDNATPAAISIASGKKEDFEALVDDLGEAALGITAGCGALCGLGLLTVGGIAALLVRRSAKPDPLAL